MSRQSLDEASRDKGQRSLLVDIVSPRQHKKMKRASRVKRWEEEGKKHRTANSTYMNQRATDTVLHRCQESHPLSSSPSNSQQQNC